MVRHIHTHIHRGREREREDVYFIFDNMSSFYIKAKKYELFFVYLYICTMQSGEINFILF